MKIVPITLESKRVGHGSNNSWRAMEAQGRCNQPYRSTNRTKTKVGEMVMSYQQELSTGVQNLWDSRKIRLSC